MSTRQAINHLIYNAREFWFAWSRLCQAAALLPSAVVADLIDRYHARKTARIVRKFLADNE